MHHLTTFPKHRTTYYLEEESGHNLETKEPHINLVENPEALGFHQEQMETMKDSTEIPGLVLY